MRLLLEMVSELILFFFVAFVHGNCPHGSVLDDYSLFSPIDSERWQTYGNVASGQNGNEKGISLSGAQKSRTSVLQVASIWSKKALPSITLTKEFTWELRIGLVTHSSPSPDHEHGFGIWFAAQEAIFPDSQWGVFSKNFTGIGVFVAEFGDFADSSSQIVDVYGVSGQEVSLINEGDEEDDFLSPTSIAQQSTRDRAHCSINSWDVHQRGIRLIMRKESAILTVKFSACDDFDLDISGLMALDARKRNLHVGISFWTTRNSGDDSIQIQKFEISCLEKGQWLVHDDSEDDGHQDEENIYEKITDHTFNFPHREVKVDSLTLPFPFNKQALNVWAFAGSAGLVKATGDREILRLTGAENVGAGAITGIKPLERRFLESYSTWQMEVVIRISSRNDRLSTGGIALWFSNNKPVVINNTTLSWNSTFTGFGIVIRSFGESVKLVYVLTINGRNLNVKWGEQQPIENNLGVKCILEQSELQSSNYVIKLKKHGNSIYASFVHCIVVFEVSSFLLIQNPYDSKAISSYKVIPLLRLGIGGWSSDVFNYRDIQSITFSEVVRVSPGAPVFATAREVDSIEIDVPDNINEIDLDCEANWVYPKPKITWRRRSGSSEEIATVLPEANDLHILNIPSPTSHIGEQYICTVENSFGNVSRTFRITGALPITAAEEHIRLRTLVVASSLMLGAGVVITGAVIIYFKYYHRKLALVEQHRTICNSGSLSSYRQTVIYRRGYSTSEVSTKYRFHQPETTSTSYS